MHQLRQNNDDFGSTGFISWWCLSLIFCLLFICYSSVSAGHTKKIKSVSPQVTPATFLDYLVQEKTHLTVAINEVQHALSPVNERDYHIEMRHVSAMLTLTTSKIDSLEGFLDNQKKQDVNLNQRLKHLQQLPVINAEQAIQEQVNKVEALIELNDKTTVLIKENLVLAKQYQIVLTDKIKRLQEWNAHFELEQKLAQIDRSKDKAIQELDRLYQNSFNKQTPLSSSKVSTNPLAYEANILINNYHITLIYQQLHSLNVQKKIVKANKLLLNMFDTKTLPLVIEIYKNGISQCVAIDKTLQKMLISLNSKSSLLVNYHLEKSFESLQRLLKIQIQNIDNQKQTLLKDLEKYQTQLKKLISSRQSLAEYNKDSLPVIINKILAIPNLFFKYMKILTLKVYDSYTWLDTYSSIILWSLLSLIFILSIILNRFLKTLRSDKERSRLTGYLYDGVLVLLQKNIPSLCLFTMGWTVFYFTNISFFNYQLLFNLITIWFAFKILIHIARLVLLERITDSSGKDVKLYYRLKWLFLSGGWTSALMVFSHVYPLSLLLQDIFNRLFMLFLLAVALVGWKSKDVIPYLLRPLFKAKKRYVKHIISLLVVLIPITLFTTAIIGLLGFVNLAWSMSRYQAYTLLVLVGYILVRGLVFDALELFSEWMISSLKNGWLWIEVFLKPLDKILRIVLFLSGLLILFQLFGWHSDSLVMINLGKIAQYSIVNFTGVHITITSIIEFFILLALFIWASKWTREFCYRWLYKNAKDVGIRNSLSVFTQYAVILTGTFITLHVLGLDFSGMSMILGGLAVGMGFGLRDFASNIVGGIMLLIERPVREGDLITLGEYEGRVAHIGIRSMRVSSWDNMEVLIPNAETFNKPFTNWTHQDSIVRTVVPIKVSQADDPVMIQQLILDVLAIIPEIVPDPPAQVFLKKIDEALIEFEARYFINVQTYTRFEVRSKVLFAITAQFKAAGVKPPIEPVSIEFKEGHGDFFIKKHSSTND